MTTHASLPSWLPAANRLVRALQRLGLPLGTIHVLTVPGRVSGQPRSTRSRRSRWAVAAT